VEGEFNGLGELTKARNTSFDGVKLASDAPGWIANRTSTDIDKHPEVFDSIDLEQAYKVGESWTKQAEDELHRGMHARATGGTLDLGPELTRTLQKHWSGKEPLTDDEAALAGVSVAREVERVTSPVAPGEDLGPRQWLEDATVEALALWPGAASATAKAMGMQFDEAAVEKIVAPARQDALAGGPVKALAGVLGLAGLDPNAADQRGKAVQLLQGAALDAVPLSLGEAVAAYQKLPEDKAEWIATRILDSAGNPRNIEGLAAQLREMTAPAPPPAEPAPPPAQAAAPPEA
jgi:hypothetical protein